MDPSNEHEYERRQAMLSAKMKIIDAMTQQSNETPLTASEWMNVLSEQILKISYHSLQEEWHG